MRPALPLLVPALLALAAPASRLSPSAASESPMTLGSGPLRYANPAWNRPPPATFRSLDEALDALSRARETQKYMRDTFGLSQATLGVEADSASSLPALRNRIIGWLDASGLRYELNESRTPDSEAPVGYAFSLGTIPVAGDYFRLRDSLIALRSASIRVRVDEVPYQSEWDLDSLEVFLRSLRGAKAGDQKGFERYFLSTFFEYRRPLADFRTRGIYCGIAVRLAPSGTDARRPPAGLPRWMAPFRDRPIVLRLDYIEAVGMLALAVAAIGLAIALASALLARRGRR